MSNAKVSCSDKERKGGYRRWAHGACGRPEQTSQSRLPAGANVACWQILLQKCVSAWNKFDPVSASNIAGRMTPTITELWADVRLGPCPSRVIRVVLTARRSLPVYPNKRTFLGSVGMSQRCRTWGMASGAVRARMRDAFKRGALWGFAVGIGFSKAALQFRTTIRERGYSR
jgi:hypothetical protein